MFETKGVRLINADRFSALHTLHATTLPKRNTLTMARKFVSALRASNVSRRAQAGRCRRRLAPQSPGRARTTPRRRASAICMVRKRCTNKFRPEALCLPKKCLWLLYTNSCLLLLDAVNIQAPCPLRRPVGTAARYKPMCRFTPMQEMRGASLRMSSLPSSTRPWIAMPPSIARYLVCPSQS